MPVVALHLFAFLRQHLAQDPFWCQRLPWVAQEAAGRPVPAAPARQHWEALRAQLQQVLAQDQTFEAFLAYLVDPQRAHGIDPPSDPP
jgi:hypothetical protein